MHFTQGVYTSNHQVYAAYDWSAAQQELEIYSIQALGRATAATPTAVDDWSWDAVHPQMGVSPPAADDEINCGENTPRFPSLAADHEGQRDRPMFTENGAAESYSVHKPLGGVGASRWMSWCFLGCIALRQGDTGVVDYILGQADYEFEVLLGSKDKLLLTATGLLVTILHANDQGSVATQIMARTEAVAARILPPSDPVLATIHFLALAADASGRDLKQGDLTPDQLWEVIVTLTEAYGFTHPYVIAALVNSAWLLKWNDDRNTAAFHASAAYDLSRRQFGRLHLQSIICLAVWAGAMDEDHLSLRVEAFRKAARRSFKVMGVLHPYTLEILRRLADSLYMLGHTGAALELDRCVLVGRAISLGRDHEFTRGQVSSYETRLRCHGRWDAEDGTSTTEQLEVREFRGGDREDTRRRMRNADFCKIDQTSHEDVALAQEVLRMVAWETFDSWDHVDDQNTEAGRLRLMITLSNRY